MEELLNLLRDGHSRSIEMLAEELNTSAEDVKRRIDFLERAGIIRRVICHCGHSCSKRSGCDACEGCAPQGGFKNMGEIWEVAK